MIFASALAALIGASLAFFGAGGSIVTMPVLVYVLGLDAHRAAGTSLVIVAVVALAAAVAHRRSASVRAALVLGGAGMLGVVPGTWLNHHVPPTVVLFGFAMTMLIAAIRMGKQDIVVDDPADTEIRPWRAVLVGVAVGTATGFFGIGGGFLIVPALRLLLNLPIRQAMATSLLVIALNSFAGLAGHLPYGDVEWRLGGELTMAALAGTVVALPLSTRVRGAFIERSFAIGVGIVGFVMLVKTVREMVA